MTVQSDEGNPFDGRNENSNLRKEWKPPSQLRAVRLFRYRRHSTPENATSNIIDDNVEPRTEFRGLIESASCPTVDRCRNGEKVRARRETETTDDEPSSNA